jgi:hypothetical protein
MVENPAASLPYHSPSGIAHDQIRSLCRVVCVHHCLLAERHARRARPRSRGLIERYVTLPIMCTPACQRVATIQAVPYRKAPRNAHARLATFRSFCDNLRSYASISRLERCSIILRSSRVLTIFVPTPDFHCTPAGPAQPGHPPPKRWPRWGKTWPCGCLV